MTAINRPNDYSLVSFQTENAPGERSGWRLKFMLAGGVLVLIGLLTPALVSREVVSSSPTPLAHQLAGMALTSVSRPGPLTQRAARNASVRLFLPHVANMASQPQSLPNKSVVSRSAPLVTSLSPAPMSEVTEERVVTVTVGAGALGAVSQRIFLALLLRADDVSHMGLPQGELAPVPSVGRVAAAAGVSNGVAGPAGGALFLPLVVQTDGLDQALSQQAPMLTPTQPGQTPTATPTTTPTLTPLPTQPPAGQTPVTGPNQGALQQLQTLLDQVDQLIASDVLSAAQGQPLRAPITAVMHFPIVTQGEAPSNPTPGQPRPWQRKMQMFSDQVHQLLDSGVLSAEQGQPLLDQAQAIRQTLGGQ